MVYEESVLAAASIRAGSSRDSANFRHSILKRKAEYSQHLTLPGAVDANAMKVERKKGMLIIAIPKKTQI